MVIRWRVYVYVFYAYHSNNEKTIAFALGMDTGNG